MGEKKIFEALLRDFEAQANSICESLAEIMESNDQPNSVTDQLIQTNKKLGHLLSQPHLASPAKRDQLLFEMYSFTSLLSVRLVYGDHNHYLSKQHQFAQNLMGNKGPKKPR